MQRKWKLLTLLVCGLTASASAMAQNLPKLVFYTNWFAEAEHGGF